MALFVHFAPESAIKSIRRSGIKKSRIHYHDTNTGVFCMPVMDNYYAVHQWLRELKRFTKKNMTAVYFRIDDHEQVYYGAYYQKHHLGTAVQAANSFMQLNDKLGFQTIVPRNITATEITRIRPVSQILGWRFSPMSKGRTPCLCPGCLGRGDYKVNHLVLSRYEQLLAKLQSSDLNEQMNALSSIADLKSDNPQRIKNYEPLLHFQHAAHPELVIRFINAIARFRNQTAWRALITALEHPHSEVKAASAWEMLGWKHDEAVPLLLPYKHIDEIAKAIEDFESC